MISTPADRVGLNVRPLHSLTPTSLGSEQKFLICKYCESFSAISKTIPTCEHCTSALIQFSLQYLNKSKQEKINKCGGCGKELYICYLYNCECNNKKYCFSCYNSPVWCDICNKTRIPGIINSIWSVPKKS
jgi:hypothetical protein